MAIQNQQIKLKALLKAYIEGKARRLETFHLIAESRATRFDLIAFILDEAQKEKDTAEAEGMNLL